MKTIFLLTSFLIMGFLSNLSAQNVGIGTDEPLQKLQVNGNLLVQNPIKKTSAAPTAGQTYTLVNNGSYNAYDSTGLVYDPSGPTGNYIANINGNINVGTDDIFNAGVEINIQEIGLGTGDSLIIRDIYDFSIVYLKVGNNYSTPGIYTFNTTSLAIYFKSNGDGIVGTGFKITYKLLYQDIALSALGIYHPVGNALFFESKSGSLISGRSSISGYSNYATALGNSTVSSGGIAIGYSTAFNGGTAFGTSDASGAWSTASGRSTTNGQNATAMGYSNATANYATAFGAGTASNLGATAIGLSTTASGAYSFAAGRNVNASTQGGFFLGDSDPNNNGVRSLGVSNQLGCRFNGGYYFIASDVGADIGVRVVPGGNAWTTLSDVRKKEKFIPVDGESILKKISTMPLTTWNYKGQDPKTFRHYGPMAQDFFAAFGKDPFGSIGSDTLINQADFLGVNLVAIQALEKRTQNIEVLIQENKNLQNENEAIKKQYKELIALFEKLNAKVERLEKKNAE